MLPASFVLALRGRRTLSSGTLTTNHENTMQTKNDTSKPEDSPKQEASEGCSGASCSAEVILAEVMQDIWSDRAMDCGEVPSCFEIKGPPTTRIYADFEGSTFVWNIVETLRARGYSILPNDRISDEQKQSRCFQHFSGQHL